MPPNLVAAGQLIGPGVFQRGLCDLRMAYFGLLKKELKTMHEDFLCFLCVSLHRSSISSCLGWNETCLPRLTDAGHIASDVGPDQSFRIQRLSLYHVDAAGLKVRGRGVPEEHIPCRRSKCIRLSSPFSQIRRFMRRNSDVFFFAEESPAQRKPAVIFLSFFFFCSNFWHNSRVGYLPRHVGECAARGLRGKIQSWMEIFKGPRIPFKLAISRSLSDWAWRAGDVTLLTCNNVGDILLCRAARGFIFNTTNTFHLHLRLPSPSSSASFSLCPSSRPSPRRSYGSQSGSVDSFCSFGALWQNVL